MHSPHRHDLILKCKVHYLNKCERHCHVCESENLNVTSEDTKMIEVTGFSVRNVSFHINALRLSINNQICVFVPIETDLFFPNLETLRIFSSGLKKIRQSDLKGFKALRELLLPLNEIESLDSDLLSYNKKIARIDLSRNRLKNVGLAFFSALKTLTYANFIGNDCIDENLKIDKILFINKVREQCEPTLSQLKNDVIFLAQENEELKAIFEEKEKFNKKNCETIYYRHNNKEEEENDVDDNESDK